MSDCTGIPLIIEADISLLEWLLIFLYYFTHVPYGYSETLDRDYYFWLIFSSGASHVNRNIRKPGCHYLIINSVLSTLHHPGSSIIWY